MTSQEKIEELLQFFGENLSDLPKASAGYPAHERFELVDGYNRAIRWRGGRSEEGFELEDFICHQSEIIEKLVKALEDSKKSFEVLDYALKITGQRYCG